MDTGLDVFAGSNFSLAIQNYCQQLGWIVKDIDSLNDSTLIVKFPADFGTAHTVFIIRHKEILEFSVPSGLVFRSMDEVPNKISTLLLSDNCTSRLGFWCLEEIGGRHTFSILHQAEIRLMNPQYFRSVVLTLFKKCDDLNDHYFSDSLKKRERGCKTLKKSRH